MSLLFSYLRPFVRRLSFLALLLAGTIGLQLLAPQIIRRFLDAAQAGAATRVLVQVGLLYFFVVLAQKVLNLGSVYLSAELGWATTNQLREDLTAHTLRLDMGFHKLRPAGELIERIDGDVSALAESFSGLVVQVGGNALLAVGILLFLGRESLAVAVVAVVYAGLTLLFMRAMHPFTIRYFGALRESFAQLSGYLEERLAGTEDLRGNGAGPYMLARLVPRLRATEEARLRADLTGHTTFNGRQLLYVAAFVLTLWLAAQAYLAGRLSIGTVYLLAAYMTMLQQPLMEIHRQLHHLQRALVGAGRVRDYFRLQPEVQTPDHGRGLPPGPLDVGVVDVSFTYRDRPGEEPPMPVLRDVSFHLPAGQVLGLLGRTGSGKTTLTRLLFRLYDVDAGAVRLGGVDVRELSPAELRQNVGLVTQDVQLFAASIRDNLTFFRRHNPTATALPDEALLAALEAVGLRKWVEELPQGLDTVLTGGGGGLSAGEAQLLALARVFLRDPRVVVLDEASSRLDPETEQRLEAAIDRLLEGRTAIVIAHRLHTVQRADRIVILENGQVEEQGMRAALAADPTSRFATLLRTGLQEVLT
ncbi:MAG: ABC transporter ATP-binding protein [Candidatus Promineifilaceae bacterium]|nr:ABC transporter ATP-binding protein [Candidatus Promineifilaceae bacterium]